MAAPPALSRPARWLSITQLLERFLADKVLSAKVAGKSKKRQLEIVRRIVRRLEHQEHQPMTTIVDGKMHVSVVALEALFPLDVTTMSSLEYSVRGLAQQNRDIRRQLKRQNIEISDLRTQIEKLQGLR